MTKDGLVVIFTQLMGWAWTGKAEDTGATGFSRDEKEVITELRSLIESSGKRTVNDVALIIKNLMEACDSLMDEVTHNRSTDWGIVNEAMRAGTKYLAKLGYEVKDE